MDWIRKFQLSSFTIIYLIALPTGLRAQDKVHLGVSSNWDYSIGLPEGTGFLPIGKGETSQLSFGVNLSIPIGPLRFTPMWSTSLPIRTLLVHNPDGDYLPNGYSQSVPYSTGSDFSYYLTSEDYEWEDSQADIYQNLYGSFITLDFGGEPTHVEIGSGLFLRKKRADIYTPIAYDEYEWYSSTGTEWDNYFYSDTYFLPGLTETFTENKLVVPFILNFCQHWGMAYTDFGLAYFTGNDPWWSFRYSMGIAF
jgi:hypothetical protein